MPVKQTKRYVYRRKEIRKKNFPWIVAVVAILAAAGAFSFNAIKETQITEAKEDDRLAAGELVTGIQVNKTAKAYPADLEIANDVVGGIPVLVAKNTAFERRLNDRVLEFTLIDGALVDSNGREWNNDGTSRYGKLAKIDSQTVPWHVWLSWHKDTQVFKTK
jgi:hypothetical protein